MVEQETWSKASVIGGHDVSKKFWMPYISEELPQSCEKGNVYDKHAVAVHKADSVIVGHTPREMSRVFWFFLHQGGTGKKFFKHLGRGFTRNIAPT